jgi:hypothetical protein
MNERAMAAHGLHANREAGRDRDDRSPIRQQKSRPPFGSRASLGRKRLGRRSPSLDGSGRPEGRNTLTMVLASVPRKLKRQSAVTLRGK